jgi:hypothetical protein
VHQLADEHAGELRRDERRVLLDRRAAHRGGLVQGELLKSRAALLASALSILAVAGGLPATAGPSDEGPEVLRIATFNASLNRGSAGQLAQDLSAPGNAQAGLVAEIVRRLRPDVLLLQEFDFDAQGASVEGFLSNYLDEPREGSPAPPIRYPHVYFADVNTGVPSGFDFDNDGKVGGGADALGFGEFPGQYGMVILSMYPIDTPRVRTFRKFLWKDMPGAMLPDDPGTPAPRDWYSPEELAVLPLSSKSHWDVPVRVGKRTLHLLVSHPTPPAFDGPEDRNGLRNHDEVRFWDDYLRGSNYLRDDAGKRGGFRGRSFVIMGDLNTDPVDGGSVKGAIQRLLSRRDVNAMPVPASEGGVEAAAMQGGMNASQEGDPRHDTADFNDRGVGNLRVDYLLPSKDLAICDSGVFWPRKAHASAPLVQGEPPPTSDHRLVWIDVSVRASGRCPPGSGPTASDP